MIQVKNKLALLAPDKANVRGLLITNEMFESIDIIAGELSIGEKIVSKAFSVIEI